MYYLFDHGKWMVLSSTSLGVFVMTLNASVVNIALPLITSYYQAPLSSVEWVVLVYLIIMSSLMLTFGRLGDLYGHKPVYVRGFLIFTVGSLLCVLSPDILSLIASRAVQAVGAGMGISVVQAIIADAFPPGIRGRAIGLNSVSVSLGLAAGPSLGGFLLSHFGWKIIFAINIPIGIASTIWAWRVIPGKKGSPQQFDILGAFLLFMCLMCFLLALSHGQQWGWGSRPVLGLLLGFLAFFAAFFYRERHYRFPMLHFKLFNNRQFTAANIAQGLNYITQYIVTFLMPFYLLNILRLSSGQAGIVMAAFPLAMIVTSPLSGIISDRIGARVPASLGMGLISASIYCLSSLEPSSSPGLVAGALFGTGLGNGLFITPNNSAIMGSVPKDQIGLASGMVATMRSIGQALGIAVGGAVLSSRLFYYAGQFGLQGGENFLYQDEVFTLAQHDTFLMAMAVGIIGMVVSLVRGAKNEEETEI
jgi:EmrB/QacA subfamily drug resistance transporter